MAGTLEGGRKAAKTNQSKHGKDFYKRIGAIGGRNGKTGGFAANPELARIAGMKGGKASKRGPAKVKTDSEDIVIQDGGGVEPTPFNGFEPVNNG